MSLAASGFKGGNSTGFTCCIYLKAKLSSRLCSASGRDVSVLLSEGTASVAALGIAPEWWMGSPSMCSQKCDTLLEMQRILLRFPPMNTSEPHVVIQTVLGVASFCVSPQMNVLITTGFIFSKTRHSPDLTSLT